VERGGAAQGYIISGGQIADFELTDAIDEPNRGVPDTLVHVVHSSAIRNPSIRKLDAPGIDLPQY
jgi:hypothetical protein